MIRFFRKKKKQDTLDEIEQLVSLSLSELDSLLCKKNVDELRRTKVTIDYWLETTKQFGILGVMITLFTTLCLNLINSASSYSRTFSIFLLLIFALSISKIVKELYGVMFRLKRVFYIQKFIEHLITVKNDSEKIRISRLQRKR